MSRYCLEATNIDFFALLVKLVDLGYKDQPSAEKAKEYFNNTYIDTSKIQVDFAKTLNDTSLVEEKQKAIERRRGKRAENDTIGNKKTENMKRFAEKMGIDTETLLKKRDENDAMDESKPPNNGVDSANQENEKQDDKIKQNKKVKAENGKKKDNIDSKRLYVYNFPFSISKEDLRELFEKHGKVNECIIPTDADKKSKGFGYVAFEEENDAIKAISQLDNTVAFGRILHIKPSEMSRRTQYVEEKPKENKKQEGSSYKKLKREEFLKNLEDETSWNSLFLNPNTVMEYVARDYGLSKLDLLSREVENPAVKIALAETKIINETKEWLRENGVDTAIFESTRHAVPRSRTTIIVKNLPKDCTKNKLAEVVGRYGFVNRLLLPPNRAIAIVQFRNIDHAANAFSKLAGYSLLGVPLYIEYAPDNLLPAENEDEPHEDDQLEEDKPVVAPLANELEEDEENQTQARTLYIKNINFSTTEDGLRDWFRSNGFTNNVKVVKIIKKDGKSCGYGFVELTSAEDAEKALRNLNMKILDSHKLELSITRGKNNNNITKRKDRLQLETSNKLVLRNIDFAASKKELRDLVAAFGEVRGVRMPSKVTGEHRGYAFIEYSNIDDAKHAYEALSHTHFYGRKLVIEYAKS